MSFLVVDFGPFGEVPPEQVLAQLLVLAYFAHDQAHPVILSALLLKQNLYLIAFGHTDEEAHFLQVFF